ncbi:hypothetical protein V6B73_04820 [Bifidobacterium breve]|uniref:hypothetical protein n=2 Tax=Bifidobacterium breve TaxID=1685 RepID=UPI002FD969D1
MRTDDFAWGNGVASMVFDAASDAPVRLVGLSGRGMAETGIDVLDFSSDCGIKRLSYFDVLLYGDT